MAFEDDDREALGVERLFDHAGAVGGSAMIATSGVSVAQLGNEVFVCSSTMRGSSSGYSS